MNLTQNDKIEQIKNETLVVGVGIGKETKFARALDYRGRELKKLIKFANSREGFNAFDKWVSEVSSANTKLEIKGIGLNAVATFVSEVGDINRFQSPKQIIKLAGMNLKEDSSGKHKGKTRLSKRGRKRLRHALFKAMVTVLATNAEFKAIHRKNITRETNPLSKMQSIFALCDKLIRIFYATLRKGIGYDPSKLLIETSSMKAAQGLETFKDIINTVKKSNGYTQKCKKPRDGKRFSKFKS